MRIWIDNDGCPRVVRDLVLTGAERKKVPVTVVGNSYAQIPPSPLNNVVCVPGSFDAADDHIAQNVQSGDLVITSDVPLASRVVKVGAVALNSHGKIFDEKSIGEELATRNLMQELRGGGLITGGPPPFGQHEKKRFADAFDRTLTKLLK